MKIGVGFRIALAIFAGLLSLSSSAGEDAKVARATYSSVEYNEEGGDLLGYEIELRVLDSQVESVLRIYEGGCGDSIALHGTVRDRSIHLTGVDAAYGKTDIIGKIKEEKSISATITFKKSGHSESVLMKRISTPHC